MPSCLCVVLLFLILRSLSFIFFFFNDTATTEIYTLSLHDALPISGTPPGSSLRSTTTCGNGSGCFWLDAAACGGIDTQRSPAGRSTGFGGSGSIACWEQYAILTLRMLDAERPSVSRVPETGTHGLKGGCWRRAR